MNNISYSELFDKEFEKVFQKHENEIEKILKSKKSEGRRFGSFYNTILSQLQAQKNSTYYIATSKLFDNLKDLYNQRNSNYEEGFEHLIFEKELLSSFNEIEQIKKGYSYIKFIKELATVEAISEVYRRFRHNSKIYEFMYFINEFDDFKLETISSNLEETELFKKYLFKYRQKLDPNCYKDFEDFLAKEEQLQITLNSISEFKSGKSELKRNSKLKTNNFKLKNEFLDTFKTEAYSILTNYEIIKEDLTYYEDFINVITEDWDKHNSKLHFNCTTEEAGYFLFKIKLAFNNLSFASIQRSRLFYSFEGNLLKEDNLSKSKNNLDEGEKDILDKALNQLFHSDRIPN